MELHHGINSYQFCPFCGARLPIDGASPIEATDHLLKCQRESALHPEVGDQLSLDEGVEAEDKLFPPEEGDHHSHK